MCLLFPNPISLTEGHHHRATNNPNFSTRRRRNDRNQKAKETEQQEKLTSNPAALHQNRSGKCRWVVGVLQCLSSTVVNFAVWLACRELPYPIVRASPLWV